MTAEHRTRHRARRALSWLSHHLGWSLALVVLLGALAVSLFRLLLPWLDVFQNELQHHISERMGTPVLIGGIGAEWQGWTPVLRLDDVSVSGGDGKVRLSLAGVLVQLDPLASLRSGSLIPRRVTIRGAVLQAIRFADGSVAVRGVATSGDAREKGIGELGAWILRESRLQIVDSTVFYEVEGVAQPPFPITEVNVSLRRIDARYRLRGRAVLPETLGGPVQFAADVAGDPSMERWHGRIFGEAVGLKLHSRLFQELLPARLSVAQAIADLRVWFELRDGTMQDARGEVEIRTARFAVDGSELPMMSAAGRFRYRSPSSEAWSLGTIIDKVETDGRPWDNGRFEIVARGRSGSIGGVNTLIDRIDLDRLAPFLAAADPVPASFRAWLEQARPKAQLTDVLVDLPLADDAVDSMQARATVHALEASSVDAMPGVAGLSGDLRVRGRRGRLVLSKRPVVVKLPRLFRDPLAADVDGGAIDWLWEDVPRLQLTAIELTNPDIHVQLDGQIRLPRDDGSPHLTLIGEFDEGRVEAVHRYLPARIMGKATTAWLDRALVSGRIPSGGLLFHGETARFPFDDGGGRFEIRAQTEDAILEYHTGWPRLEGVELDAAFINRGMFLDSGRAQLLGAELQSVEVAIADMAAKDPILSIRGEATGSGQDGLRLVLETPLRERFESHLAGSRISGDIATTVELSLGLASGGLELNAAVDLRGNRIEIPPLALELTDVDGELGITEHGLSGRNIAARLDDLPLRMDLESVGKGSSQITRVRARGHVNPEALAARHGVDLPPWIRGGTDWRAVVDIPGMMAHKDSHVNLTAVSELDGLTVDLPPPIGKVAGTARRLTVSAHPGPQGTLDLTLAYADIAKAVIGLLKNGNEYTLGRGAIRFGTGRPELPRSTGITVTGQLGTLDLGAWMTQLAAHPRTATDGQRPTRGPLREIDISVDRLQMGAQRFDEVRFRGQRDATDAWSLEMESPRLAGRVALPGAGSDRPVVIDLDRLQLDLGKDGARRNAVDPRTLPGLKLNCRDCSLGRIALGTVQLTTSPRTDGVRLENFRSRSPELELTASGDWLVKDGSAESRYNIYLKTPDIGGVLNKMDYDNTGLDGGRARVRLDAVWPGSPDDFAVERVTGMLQFKLREGRLLEVNPGAAGRVFGLLSLPALPRRLKLDFRDLYSKGLSYDKIEGTFTIDNGDAYTNDLTMKTPSGRIDMAGRVGLISQDYDQTITLTPEISSTLPVAGAIAGGPIGAAVGAAAALFAEKVLKNPVGKAIETQYNVTGPWTNPTVERISGASKTETGRTPDPAPFDF